MWRTPGASTLYRHEEIGRRRRRVSTSSTRTGFSSGSLAVEGPVKAAQFDADGKARLVRPGQALESSDVLVLLVDHDDFKAMPIPAHPANRIIDTRGVWAHEQTLQRYEHLRKGQNDAMMHSMSAIGWIETTQLFPVVWARNLGLKQVEQLPVLKDAFMAQANGLGLLKDTRYAV